MAPTDREFDRLVRAVEALEGKVDRMQATLDQQAGWFAAAKWLGAGSLASILGVAGWFWSVVRGH